MRKLTSILCLLYTLVSPAYAANFVSVAGGNLTTAATWGTTDATGGLTSTSASVTALTTGNLDSTSFVLGNSQVGGFAVRLGARASGSPSNTMTVILRNSTTATNTCSVTVNVSDLPASTTGADDGGWHYFKCAAAFTPNGTDSYLIRATLSATTTAVSLCTNGTSNNWQHLTVRTTTGAPGAGDDVYIVGIFDGVANPATTSTVTVTMDSTANTDYGSANTSGRIAAVSISNRGTLTWGTTASTTYIHQLSGWEMVFSGGTLNIGTNGTPMPASSTATLQFDEGADEQFGLSNRAGGTINIYGADKGCSWDLMAADAAAAATTLTMTTACGWKTGDVLVIASTSRTATNTENFTLGADQSGTTVTLPSGLAFAHGGNATTYVQAEVGNTTRNVIVKTVTASSMMRVAVDGPFTSKWTRFDGLGQSSGGGLNLTNTPGGTVLLQYNVFINGESTGFVSIGFNCGSCVALNFTVDNNLFYMGGGANVGINVATQPSSGVITNNAIIGDNSSGNAFNFVSLTNYTFTGNHIAGGTAGWVLQAGQGGGVVDVSNNYIHSMSGIGFDLGNGTMNGYTIGKLVIWRTASNAIRVTLGGGVISNVTFNDLTIFGAGSDAIQSTSGAMIKQLTLNNCRLSGDSSFSSGIGISGSGGSDMMNVLLEGCKFGELASIYTKFTTADLSFSAAGSAIQIRARNTIFNSTTEVNTPTNLDNGASFFSKEFDDQTVAHSVRSIAGIVSYETTTVERSPSIKLSPGSAGYTLDTAGRQPGRGLLIPISSGRTATVTVDVRKDGTYNGTAPRLLYRANGRFGTTTDTVCDTLSVGTNTWETLTCTTGSAAAATTLEFVVDCLGSAGAVFVDNWKWRGVGIRDDTWKDGLPILIPDRSTPVR